MCTEFGSILKALDHLRAKPAGTLRSVKTLTSMPDHNITEWLLERFGLKILAELPRVPQLSSLYIVDCAKLESIAGVAVNFPRLRKLWIIGSDRLRSLDGIQSLEELEELKIWPSFSGHMSLDTLEPLENAKGLKTFSFAGRTRDGSLGPLLNLKSLSRIFISNSYSWEEFARFEARRPEVQFLWKGGVTYDANPSALICQRCGSAQAMLTGKGLKLCCPSCEADRLGKHLRRYAALAAGTGQTVNDARGN